MPFQLNNMFVCFDGTLFSEEITTFQLRKQQYNFLIFHIESTMNATVTSMNIQHLENTSFGASRKEYDSIKRKCDMKLCVSQQYLIVNCEFNKSKMNASFRNLFPSFKYPQFSVTTMHYQLR